MKLEEYVDEIKLELTGNLLHSELPDTTLAKVVNKAFREVQRYIDTSKFITIPYAGCIDLSNSEVSSVVKVYRVQSEMGSNNSLFLDPMWIQQAQFFSGVGGTYSLNNWMTNYASWCTSLQIRNTISTDLAFKYDKQGQKLYVNIAFDKPYFITVEYIPYFHNVEEITSDYWIDILVRLSVAMTKQILGRIRSKYSQTGAVWALDGETLLAEGNAEIQAIRDNLVSNSQLCYPID